MADKESEDQQTDGFGPDREDPDLKIDPFEPKSILDEELVAGEEDDELTDSDFSFPSIAAASSPISADDAFLNGQIRPTLPFVDWRAIDEEAAPGGSFDPLRKLFAAEEAEGTAEEIKCAAGLGRKSNSTGSSRLRRFRELIHRSSSEGKDAFVFLNPPDTGSSVKAAEKKADKKKEKKASAAHETLYGNGKNKAAEKRRSYLPYRPGLVGFFTNANGMSKNVHPF